MKNKAREKYNKRITSFLKDFSEQRKYVLISFLPLTTPTRKLHTNKRGNRQKAERENVLFLRRWSATLYPSWHRYYTDHTLSCTPSKFPILLVRPSPACFIPRLRPPGATLSESVLVAPPTPLADVVGTFRGARVGPRSKRESRSHFRFHYDVSSCFRGFAGNYRHGKLAVVVWNVYLQFLLEGTWCRFLGET